MQNPSVSPVGTGQGRDAAPGKLINIDNGGTLTDICVIDGADVYRTKTLTTPHDLSQCLFEGLKKASRAIYGKEDLQSLLLSTASIRYSTTQGTNALVERKGPRLGVLIGGGLTGAGEQLFGPLRTIMAYRALSKQVVLKPAALGDVIGIMGGAALCMD